LGFTLKLNYPEPKCTNNQGEVFSDRQIKKQLKNALEIQHLGVIKSDNWQGRLLKSRAEDDELEFVIRLARVPSPHSGWNVRTV